jgi:Family of unknown function (DUF5320)
MPGFDGTGPGGMGPMTGGGRGFCGTRGVRSSRRGRGASRIPATPYGEPAVVSSYGYSPGMTAEQEMESLRSQAQAMSEQLEQIQKRLQELEGK